MNKADFIFSIFFNPFNPLNPRLKILLPFSLEEAEIHAAIDASFHEVWVALEAIAFAMFEHEETTFFQKLVLEDEAGDSLQSFKFVGRVGKDKVKPVSVAGDVLEYIAPNGQTAVGLHFFHNLADEAMVVAVFLHADHLLAAAAHQLDADAACTGKEVKRTESFIFEVNIVAQDIEKILLGKVGCRTGLEGTGYFEASSLVYSTDYSHVMMASKSRLVLGFIINTCLT